MSSAQTTLTAHKTKAQECLSSIGDKIKELDSRALVLDQRQQKLMTSLRGPDKTLQSKSLVVLCVGGKRVECYRSTLCKYPGSLLEIVFSGRQNVQTLDPKLCDGKSGVYFLDRDPQLFMYVLDALRDDLQKTLKNMGQDTQVSSQDLLVRELEFFGLPIKLQETTTEASTTPTAIEPQQPSTADELCDALKTTLTQYKTDLDRSESDLRTFQEKIANEVQVVRSINRDTRDAIRISVSGEKFVVCRSTLCAGGRDSMLTPMFQEWSNHTVARNDEDEIFLDRNPHRFHTVLHVLRHNRHATNLDVEEDVDDENTQQQQQQNKGGKGEKKVKKNVRNSTSSQQLPTSTNVPRFDCKLSVAVTDDLKQMGIEVVEGTRRIPSAILDNKMEDTLLKMFDVNKAPKSFRLLLTSQPLWQTAEFHAAVRGVGPTLYVIKNTQGHVFGAYVPQTLTFTANAYIAPMQGQFLFAVGNMTGVPVKLLHSGSDQYGIYDGAHALSVGGGNDLIAQQGTCSCTPRSFQQVAAGYGPATLSAGFLCGTPGTPTFTPTIMEVFAVSF